MGTIVDQMEGPSSDGETPVRCPLCGRGNTTTDRCRHVRWTFAQGDPLDFARHALEASPFTSGRGYSIVEIPAQWWPLHGERLIELIDLHFGVHDGFVFGELVDIDVFARDVWRIARPEPIPAGLVRID